MRSAARGLIVSTSFFWRAMALPTCVERLRIVALLLRQESIKSGITVFFINYFI